MQGEGWGGLIVVSWNRPRDSAPAGLKVTALVNLLSEVAVIILDRVPLTTLFPSQFSGKNVLSHASALTPGAPRAGQNARVR